MKPTPIGARTAALRAPALLSLLVAAAPLAAACDFMTYGVYRDAKQTFIPADVPETGAMAAVAGGRALLGCNEAADSACEDDERPFREATLSPFEIDRTEVSRAVYRLCVEAGRCGVPACEWGESASSQLPVVCVTWDQARAFCEWAGKRLPTEAEWERAARAEGSVYPWGDAAPGCDRAAHAECGGALAAVGGHAPGASADGVLDLAGNAAEWVADWYSAAPEALGHTVDPRGPAEGERRVIKGGSADAPATSVRSAARQADVPGATDAFRGFRCARTPAPVTPK